MDRKKAIIAGVTIVASSALAVVTWLSLKDNNNNSSLVNIKKTDPQVYENMNETQIAEIQIQNERIFTAQAVINEANLTKSPAETLKAALSPFLSTPTVTVTFVPMTPTPTSTTTRQP